jgi:hypothetical protein
MTDIKEPPQPEEWHLIGLLSSFPDISQDNERRHVLPGCKTLSVPKTDKPQRTNRLSDLDYQVLVFKYKGFLHAIDNARFAPLSAAMRLLSLAMPALIVPTETRECF